jgi:excisionase family DNA binding protein
VERRALTGHATAPRMSRSARQAHLTIAELCDELDISRSTFYEWRAKRTAPRCFKLPNGELRIKRDDLDTWIDSRQEAA